MQTSILSFRFRLLAFVFVFALVGFAARAQTVNRTVVDFGSGGQTGADTSIVLANGTPAISYYNITEGNLMYARNSAADGSGTWTVATLDSTGDVGQGTVMVIVNGNPAIVYLDDTTLRIKYIRANDPSGTTWGAPVNIAAYGFDITGMRMAVVNGNPAVAYSDRDTGTIEYVRANDANGATWGTEVVLDTVGSSSRPSLAVVNGRPAISYYFQTTGDLRYIRASDVNGTAWDAPVTVTSAGDVGPGSSMVVVNGNPAIAFLDNANIDLKYARAADVNGASWGAPVTIDSIGFVGQQSSLVIVNGRPAISYFDNTNDDLKYVRASDINGTAWGAPMAVDTAGSVGSETSIAIVDGNPAISYADIGNSMIKYVRASNADGTAWGVPLVIDAGSFNDMVVANGNASICYYDVTEKNLTSATIIPPPPLTAPIVSTPTSASIAATSATLGGNVVTDGGAAILERGVVYALTSANADPLINGSGVAKVVAGGTTGVFTVSVTGLSAGRGYSFKAYATNSVGTTYTTPVATFTTGLGSTVVINTNDSGIGSLRQAVLNANANAGADPITFDPTFFATARTIVLAGSNLAAFTSDTTVTGPAAGVTVQGVSGSVFTVGAGTTASFSKLTVSGGSEGIRNLGTLTASNCVFFQNSTGINNANSATVTGCSFAEGDYSLSNGVLPVNAAATLTVSDCSFTAFILSFIDNNGTATLSGCTADTTGNFNTYFLIWNHAGGTLTLTNCSLLQTESSAYGMLINLGTLAFQNCTLAETADSYNTGTVTLKNTIYRKHPSSGGGSNGTPFTDGGGNLILTSTGNLPAHLAADLTTLGLDPTGLQNNGGPTKTFKLLGGAAINGGVPANVPVGVTTDQRGSGFPRLVGTVDIGAYEAPLPPAVIAWDDFLRPQNSGAGWTSNWTVAPPIGVNLTYPGLNSGGYAAGGPVNFPGALRDLPAQTTGVVYLSALISGTSYANVTLYNGASELLGFGIVYSGTGPATQYGAFDNTRNLRSYSTVNVNGARHLIVIRVDLDANTFAGWVDPNLAAPLGAPAFSSSTTGSYDFNRLRLEIGPGSQVDELRVMRVDPELIETQTTSPAVSAPVAFGLTDNAASLSATVAGGGLPITEVGVVYAPTSVDADPNPGDAGVLQVSGAAFPVGIAGLSPGVSYSYKTYATNAIGTTFTGASTFTTAIPAVIAWDDFLRQQDSGAGWTSNWTGAVAGIGANLVYPGLNSGGYAAAGPVGFPGALRDLPPQTTGVVYLSALVSGTSYANVTLYNGGTELIGFGIVWSGTGPATQYGTYDNTRSVRSYSTVNVDGGTHLVVVRVDLDANTLSGWVDPNLSAPLGAPAFSSSTTFATGYDFTKVRLELGSGSQIDELRVVRANPELLETQVTSPAISGQTATGILLTTATLGGNVTQDGALPIIERGFVISATTVNGNPIAGGVGVTTLATTGTTGLYSLGVTSLAQGVSYCFKGYATNAIGTTYTAVGTFNTLANAAPTDITLSSASIAENNIAGATIGTLTATDADGGDTHTFTFAGGADDGAFTITGSTLTINGSADFEAKSSYTVRIRATDSGAENLAFEKDFIVRITDVTLPQAITFDPLGNKTFGDANFTVAASGGASGQPVTFSIFSGPATIDGSTVTITGAGSVTVRASQAGGGDYSAAADVDRSFLVAKATQSITFTPPASAYQPQTITLTATGGGSGNAVTFSVVSGPGSLAGDALTFTATGDVRVRASQAGNANYFPAAEVEATITVLAAGPPAVDDAVTMTTGPSVLYPLANDGAPEANILSVSNSDVVIDGRALIVPAGTTGTFTYTNDQGRTATVTVNTITPNVAPQRFSGLLYNSTGAIVGRAVTNRTAAGINTFSAQIGSATGKSVFTFPVSGNSAMGIATELGSVSATLGENGHLLVTMTGGITGDLRPSALSPTPAVYNVGLAAVSTSLKGGGFGTVRIGSGGAGKILVKMPDGRAFSAATEMADNGSVTFYGRQAASTPFGYVGGEFILANLTKTDLTGELEWSRPAQFSRVDRAAVNTVVVANGCITNGTFGIPDGAATMTFSGGNYAAPAAYSVNVSGGAVTPFLPTLRFWTPIATSQTFKFRFLQPGRTIDSTGTGMYFQKSGTALGYFPGLLISGKVELQCMSW